MLSRFFLSISLVNDYFAEFCSEIRISQNSSKCFGMHINTVDFGNQGISNFCDCYFRIPIDNILILKKFYVDGDF